MSNITYDYIKTNSDVATYIKATPHNYRLTPLSFTRLIFFRHNIQNSLEIHTVFLRSFCLF